MERVEAARKALSKPSPYGPDLDLSSFRVAAPGYSAGEPPRAVSSSVKERVGIDVSRASYVQVGETIFARVLAERLFREYGVVVKPLSKALKEDGPAARVAWSLIDPATDKYTAYAYLYGGEAGYYVYVPPGVKVDVPIYTCLSLFTGEEVQFAHNVVYLDEGAEAVVTTGCLVPHGVKGGLHVGLSEFFVGPGARLVFTMLHAWGEGTHVRPRTAVRVEEGGEYVSYYAVYSPVASLQTYPRVYLYRRASAKLTSVVAGTGPGVYDVGGGAVLLGEGSSAELVSRVLGSKGSTIVSRGSVEAEANDVKGHIECLGVMLDPSSTIEAVPVLKSRVERAELTHEAAIGMLSGEKIEYLMARGFSEEEARSILLRGYLTAETPGLPESVKGEIERVIEYVVRHALG
ncbi:SufD family Fe-S cluster assembly protein [Thermofilum pendens]|nr:SufD family Fe-S cluster assembly protein [Thermofilum pendens]